MSEDASYDEVINQLASLEQELNDITSAASPIGTLLCMTTEGSALVVSTRGISLVKTRKWIDPGTALQLDAKTGQILRTISPIPHFTTAKVVRRFFDRDMILVEPPSGGDPCAVLFSSNCDSVKPGDTVTLDPFEMIALSILEPEPEKTFRPEFPPVLWSDVGGLEPVKQQLIEAIEWPSRFPRLFSHYGRTPPKGLLLWGPPGNGKTLLARAVGTSISGLTPSPDSFLYVKTPELLSRFVGAAEQAIRDLFARAGASYARTGIRPVIFFDEADALMNRRGSGISTDIDRTIVPTFLTEMDGLSNSNTFIILATNRPDTLDPAIIRPGRIDIHIEVPTPSLEDAISILSLHLEKLPLGDQSPRVLAETFLLEHFSSISSRLSGARLALVAQTAAGAALRRDVISNCTSSIQLSDLISAI